MSLIIHLIFLVRGTINNKPASGETGRTVILLLLPYLIGLFGIANLRMSTSSILSNIGFFINFITVIMDSDISNDYFPATSKKRERAKPEYQLLKRFRHPTTYTFYD
ncbi:hypothetical protein M422DRAFT_262275 [Sphaerobolus stellatus SS14]|uniref:Uncharacterized protein n=1 Tax=Sphaerobolus stellatus (strain SS14) TaxID=990650 RepID=A0A0C9VDL8_SPHS4|nr:hypothetical protein M422DRAFT_262275 [Sphaerobolus stellatus SS14]